MRLASIVEYVLVIAVLAAFYMTLYVALTQLGQHLKTAFAGIGGAL